MASLVTNLNSLYVTGAENWKLGHDWRLVRTHRRHDATRLRCRQIVQPRRNSSRLSPTSREFNTHRRRDSTRQLSRVGVGGVYWALAWLHCRVELCRRCVLNSQLVGDSVDESEQICCQRSRAESCQPWVTQVVSNTGSVAVSSSNRLPYAPCRSWFAIYWRHQILRFFQNAHTFLLFPI